MTQLQLLTDWSGIVLNVAFWVSFALPLLTLTFWRWYETSFGRNLMALDVCIGLGLLGAVLEHDWGLTRHFYLLFGWIAVTSIMLIPFILIHRTWITFKRQRSGAIADLTREAKMREAANDESPTRLQVGNNRDNVVAVLLPFCYCRQEGRN